MVRYVEHVFSTLETELVRKRVLKKQEENNTAPRRMYKNPFQSNLKGIFLCPKNEAGGTHTHPIRKCAARS